MNKFKYNTALICALLVSCSALAAQIDLSSAVIVADSSNKHHATAARMLQEEIEKRTRITLPITQTKSAGAASIVLATMQNSSLNPPADLKVSDKPDSYALWTASADRNNPVVNLVGRDDRGLIFAAGRLLRTLKMTRDKLSLDSDFSIATAPQYKIRGHQQAYRPKTNSYDGWTVKMWEQSIRDLAVFGTNAIELLPPRTDDDADSPHFPLKSMQMMIEMSRICDEYDLDVWIWFPAIDEDYTNKNTVKAAMKEWGAVFKLLPRVDAVFVPGGDPGNTHPKILLPFIKKQKELLNKYHPKAQMWFSPQGFDRPGKKRDGWGDYFYKMLQKEKPAWLDGIVFGPQVKYDLPELRKMIPQQYPIRRYPDITHSIQCQYPVNLWDRAYYRTLNREPINPRPVDFTEIFRMWEKYSVGFIAYSEGCNDDVNKFIWSNLGWDSNTEPMETLQQYSRYFISDRLEKQFAQGLLALENNWRGRLLENEGVYETLELFQQMEKTATPQELLNWRFQMGLYRAYYDAYVRARLIYETQLQARAIDALRKVRITGSAIALQQAQSILDEAQSYDPNPQWRARIFELAEALFQSIHMQLSVEKYQAIGVRRGANLDLIDKPLNDSTRIKADIARLKKIKPESERIKAVLDYVQ